MCYKIKCLTAEDAKNKLARDFRGLGEGVKEKGIREGRERGKERGKVAKKSIVENK